MTNLRGVPDVIDVQGITGEPGAARIRAGGVHSD